MNDALNSKANPLSSENGLLRWLHIFALCSFGIVQPLLTVLQTQTVYLIDRKIGWSEIAITLSVLLLVPPLMFCLLDVLARRTLAKYGRNVVLFVLFAIVLMSIVRKYVSTLILMRLGVTFMLLFAIVVPTAWLAVHLYSRTRWFQTWLTIASLGIVVFPLSFVWQFGQLLQQASNQKTVQVGNPIPVVLMVFDEFSLTTLMNDQMQIDSVRFPGFARLANRSTWYRNATTVHPRTDIAVPAILSGRFPVVEKSPVEFDYPGNLLQLVKSSNAFDQAVLEPQTRLSPADRADPRTFDVSTSQKVTDLLRTMAIIYPRMILTSDVPIDLPPPPIEWSGIHVMRDRRFEVPFEWTDGLFNHSGMQNRPQQLDQFLRCIKPTEKPHFAFMHAMIPHCPWAFFPTGEQYHSESLGDTRPLGGLGELAEDWTDDASIVLRNQFRHRLQVGYVDRFIDRLLDRMEEVGIMDECLLVITADHGVSFRPKHSRRIPDAENVPDILSIPLFIKLPGQTVARIDDSNVESVDILPTIADVLKMDLTDPVDGTSVLNEQRRPRKTFYFEQAMTVLEPNLPQREAAVRRQFALFGDRPLDVPPAGMATHPEWHGRQVSSFPFDDRPVTGTLIDSLRPVGDIEDLSNATLVQSFVAGYLRNGDFARTPVELIVAIDGVVRDTGRTIAHNGKDHYFEFLLPLALSSGLRGRTELYLVEQPTSEPRLRRLELLTEHRTRRVGDLEFDE